MMHNENEILGDNTDGEGLVRDLQDNCNVPISGMRILILGAGGAAAPGGSNRTSSTNRWGPRP